MNASWVDLPDFDDGSAKNNPFHALSYAKRGWSDNTAIRYRIYTAPTEFVVVEAPTASIALHLSNIPTPHKIERFIQEYQLIVDDNQLTDAVDVYVRPILDSLTDESPILSSQILNGLEEAHNELSSSSTDSHPVTADTALPHHPEAPPETTAEAAAPHAESPTTPPAATESSAESEDIIAPPSLKNLIADGEEMELIAEQVPEMAPVKR